MTPPASRLKSVIAPAVAYSVASFGVFLLLREDVAMAMAMAIALAGGAVFVVLGCAIDSARRRR